MNAWQRLDDGSTIHKVGYRTIVSKQFRMNDGTLMKADIGSGDNAQAAAVIALTPDNKVIIARQFRCGPEHIMDELPGGMVDPGENPEQSVIREMREEVGYESTEVEFIGKVFINAWDNMQHYYYIARNCYQVHKGTPEQFEEIEIDLISIDDLIHNAKTSNMTDIQAVLLGYDKLQSIKGEL